MRARNLSDTMSATAHLRCCNAIQTCLSSPEEKIKTGVSGPDAGGNPRSNRNWRALESILIAKKSNERDTRNFVNGKIQMIVQWVAHHKPRVFPIKAGLLQPSCSPI